MVSTSVEVRVVETRGGTRVVVVVRVEMKVAGAAQYGIVTVVAGNRETTVTVLVLGFVSVPVG